MRKNILVRGVDEEAYRRGKAAAAEKGIPLGVAVSEALSRWAEEERKPDVELRVKSDRAFVRSNWKRLERHKGEAVVVADGRLQETFKTYDQAREFSSRFEIALAFVVEEPPSERELEIGPKLEIQP